MSSRIELALIALYFIALALACADLVSFALPMILATGVAGDRIFQELCEWVDQLLRNTTEVMDQ